MLLNDTVSYCVDKNTARPIELNKLCDKRVRVVFLLYHITKTLTQMNIIYM